MTAKPKPKRKPKAKTPTGKPKPLLAGDLVASPEPTDASRVPITLPLTDGTVTHMPMQRPFDREAGEMIGRLGRDFTIVPTSKWADTTLFAEAVRRATHAFAKTSARGCKFSDETILIQEYHAQDRIAFVFAAWARQIGMRSWSWLYIPVVMQITPPLKAHLVLTGRWKSAPRH